MRRPKILTYLEVMGLEFRLQRTDGGPHPTRDISLASLEGADWVIAGDDSSEDLIKAIEDLVHVHAELADFEITVSSSGIIGIAVGAGQTVQLTWKSTGTTLRDWFRFTGASLVLTDTPQTGSHAHHRGLYMTSSLQVDLPGWEPRTSTSKSSGGVKEVLTAEELKRVTCKVRYDGEPRSTEWSEYRSFEEFRRAVTKGWHFRLYPDTNESVAPFDEDTDRWGYELWWLEGGRWQHQPESEGYYASWLGDLQLEEWVDPGA